MASDRVRARARRAGSGEVARETEKGAAAGGPAPGRSLGPRMLPAWTGLRGLAVAAILLYGYFPSAFRGGWLAFSIFLFLAGYLVTQALLTAYRQTQTLPLAAFWIRRLVRVYPSLIALLTVSSAVGLALAHPLLYCYPLASVSALLGFNNIWQISAGFPAFEIDGVYNIFRHLYFLSILIQLFILWPLGLRLLALGIPSALPPKRKLRQLRYRVFLLAGGLFVFSLLYSAVRAGLGTSPDRLFYGTDTQAYPFMAGALVAGLAPQRRLQKLRLPFSGLVQEILFGVPFLLMLLAFIFVSGTERLSYILLQPLFCLLLIFWVPLLAVSSSSLSRIFSNRILKALGERAYAIYLWHFAIREALRAIPATQRIPSLLSLLLQILLLLLLTESTHHFLETDFRATLRNVLHTFRAAPANIFDKGVLRAMGVALAVCAVLASWVAAMIISPQVDVKSATPPAVLSESGNVKTAVLPAPSSGARP